MNAEALTQAEIDALLRGETPPPQSDSGPSQITPDEEDTLNAYAGMVSESGNEVYSTLLGEQTTVTLEGFEEGDTAEIAGKIPGGVFADFNYKGLVQGKSVIALEEANALKIANQMTGGGGDSDFGDLEESAFGEAVQQLFSNVNTKLAGKAGGEVQLDPPEVTTKPDDVASVMPDSADKQILMKYTVQSGAVSGTMYQVIPRNLLSSLSSALAGSAPAAGADNASMEGGMPRGATTAPELLSAPAQFMPQEGYGGMEQAFAAPNIDVDTRNLELILDIKLEIKVELGRTSRKIRDVLELGPGSVIELDKLSGEPVDILVNDKLFAKGEVVVIDENFGVRITDILSIQERIEALK